MPIETTRRDSVTIFYINMLAQPDPVMTRLNDFIFNPELSREFRGKYIDTFGTVDTDALTYRNRQYAEMNDRLPDEATFENSRAQRKQYGEFVVKRLVEWHADNHMKSEPELRTAYEVKQTISNVAVSVSESVRVDVNASLAGDTVDLLIHNPYVETRYVFDTRQAENKLVLRRRWDEKTMLQSEVLSADGISAFEIQKLVNRRMSAVLRTSSWYQPVGKSIRETKTALIFGINF